MKKNMKTQKPFQNSWNITYEKPAYDALGDPHASYYFLGKPMKKHLSKLRKSVNEEGKFTQRKKIKNLIKQRLQLFNQAQMMANITKAEPYFGKLKSQSSTGSIYKSKEFKNISQSKQKHQTIYQGNKSLEKMKIKTYREKKEEKVTLPKMGFRSIQTRRNQYSLSSRKKYQQDDELDKIQKLNKTEHNKFLRFLMNRRRTIETNNIENDSEK